MVAEEVKSERGREIRETPLIRVDRSKWPKGVRRIGLEELDGLGVDRDGRLYWDGKPVEIIGRRLDLTRSQFAVAVIVAIATVIAALTTTVQAWTAYRDMACAVNWPAWPACPPSLVTPVPSPEGDKHSLRFMLGRTHTRERGWRENPWPTRGSANLQRCRA